MNKNKENEAGENFENFEDWENAEGEAGGEDVQAEQEEGLGEIQAGEEFQEFDAEQGGVPDEFAEEPHEEGAEANQPPQKPAPQAKPSVPPREPQQSQSQGSATGIPPKFGTAALDLAPDVPVQVIAVIGKRGVTIKELMELKQGQVIDLKRPPNETVDVVVNGKLFARGELVEIDGKLGVRILKLVR